MKKAFKFMVVAAVLAFAANSSLMAQFKFGAKASGTINNMFLEQDTTKDLKRSPVIGFNVGVMAEYFLNESMSVGAELLFAQQGYKRSEEGTDYKIEQTLRTNHINLPILFRYYIGGLAIEAGPQIGFCFGGKMKAHTEMSAGTITVTHDTTLSMADIESEYQKAKSDFKAWNRINVGGTIGLSYTLPMGVFLGARYTYDFTNAFNDLKVDGTDLKQESSKSHHSVISISVGYKF